ncbi:MAG: hypothetical protein FRX49_11008 [Trebouxia sp. A1-2]|nr:MAG: hypothetical protein FRX49_11008 [Trebouxia sp. A1-2]
MEDEMSRQHPKAGEFEMHNQHPEIRQLGMSNQQFEHVFSNTEDDTCASQQHIWGAEICYKPKLQRTLARSAPVNPGTREATSFRSTSSSSFLLRACTFKISRRPFWYMEDTHLSVKTPRPHQSVIQDVSSVSCCDDNDASVALKAVHLCQQLVQGLLTLIIASTNTSSTRPTDRINLIYKDNAWSLTLDAPTPTNISTNSDPEMLKKGTPASPAMALASRVLPVPGGPTSRTPLGIRAPTAVNRSGLFKNSTT